MNSELDIHLQRLSDPDINVRLNAVAALHQIGEAAVVPLCHVFTNGSKEARWMASSALGKIGDVRAIKPLCRGLADNDGDIRACAVCALAEIGSGAVPEVCQMLNHQEWVARACAANALGKIGDTRAVTPLQEALRRIDRPARRLISWMFDERIDFKSGVRQTARAAEASAIRSAIEEIKKNQTSIASNRFQIE
jgi:HEAT repeat protein